MLILFLKVNLQGIKLIQVKNLLNQYLNKKIKNFYFFLLTHIKFIIILCV